MEYSELQEKAIDSIVNWYGNPFNNEYYLAGYAGTGKSTVVSEAVARIRQKYGSISVMTMAYTAKAAHVLRAKGNPGACTIHSAIYSPIEDPLTGEVTFSLNILGPASMADLIIPDECSMIDQATADDLRSFGKKLLIIGDPGQLPPINGEGAFTARSPDFFLNEIHRQALDSGIIELATMARQGIALPIGYNKNGVRVMSLTNANVECIHNPETQVLCGVHRVRWPVTQLMRARLGYTEQVPMPGERIICRRNNKEKGLFNGGMGKLANIQVIHDGAYKISANIEGNFQKNLLVDPFLFRQHFDGGQAKYDFKKKRNQFDWAYICSVHSSQGSGWKDVTLIDNSDSFRENKWKHLYTGLTRAEDNLTVLI